MRVFKVDKDLRLTAADLLALIMKNDKEVHMHPIVSDLLDYNDLENKLQTMPVHLALATCSKILRAVSSLYTVGKILKGDYSDV